MSNASSADKLVPWILFTGVIVFFLGAKVATLPPDAPKKGKPE